MYVWIKYKKFNLLQCIFIYYIYTSSSYHGTHYFFLQINKFIKITDFKLKEKISFAHNIENIYTYYQATITPRVPICQLWIDNSILSTMFCFVFLRLSYLIWNWAVLRRQSLWIFCTMRMTFYSYKTQIEEFVYKRRHSHRTSKKNSNDI